MFRSEDRTSFHQHAWLGAVFQPQLVFCQLGVVDFPQFQGGAGVEEPILVCIQRVKLRGFALTQFIVDHTMRGSLLGAFAIAVQFAERAALHMRRQIKALYKIHVSSSFLIRTYFEYSILSPERQAALKLHTNKKFPLMHPLVLTPSAYKRGDILFNFYSAIYSVPHSNVCRKNCAVCASIRFLTASSSAPSTPV